MKEFSAWVFESFGTLQALIAYVFIGVLSLVAGTIGHFFRLRFESERPGWGSLVFNQAVSVLVGIVVFWLRRWRFSAPRC
jgi:uncharacterized membrane protein HdeD (DUF308 family)